MIKRVALARALIMDPPLLLLDEPTAGLDPESADGFCDLLRGLHRELGLTVVMVTHDLDTLFDLSTRIAVLADQKVIVAGHGARRDRLSASVHPRVLPRRPWPARHGSPARRARRGSPAPRSRPHQRKVAAMENKAHALAAGAFVLGLVAVLVALVVWLTRDDTVRNVYELSTRDAVSGLQPQAMVRYRGIAVGKVTSIDFDPKVKGNVRVRITVDERVPLTHLDLRHAELPGRDRPGLHRARRQGRIAGGAGARQRRPAAHPAQALAAGAAAGPRRGHHRPGRGGRPSASTRCWATTTRSASPTRWRTSRRPRPAPTSSRSRSTTR